MELVTSSAAIMNFIDVRKRGPDETATVRLTLGESEPHRIVFAQKFLRKLLSYDLSGLKNKTNV